MNTHSGETHLARRAYRAGEAAAILGMSRVTLWRRMRDGTIRTVLIGGVRLVPADAIEDLLRPPADAATV